MGTLAFTTNRKVVKIEHFSIGSCGNNSIWKLTCGGLAEGKLIRCPAFTLPPAEFGHLSHFVNCQKKSDLDSVREALW